MIAWRLHPNQIVGLRLVATGQASIVQRAQLRFFARNGLAEWRETDERGRKLWRLTEAGNEALDKAKDMTTPNVPRSPMPASGYYVDGTATKRKPDRYDRPVQPPGVFKKGLTR
jgi:DNA-binding PadR family transcriptional regulator